MQQFKIEHRIPKKGETYIGGLGLAHQYLVTAGSDWPKEDVDVLVPVAPEWPDPPVIVIDEGELAGLWFVGRPVVAVRRATGGYVGGYLDELGRYWVKGRGKITAWHKYVPDGYAPQEPRREYTADDLDNLPEDTCVWDERGDVWQRGATHWFIAGGSGAFTNPLRERGCSHLYSAPKPGENR